MFLSICLFWLLTRTIFAQGSCASEVDSNDCEDDFDHELYGVSLLQSKMIKESDALETAVTSAKLDEAMDSNTDLEDADVEESDEEDGFDGEKVSRALLSTRGEEGEDSEGRRRRRRKWGKVVKKAKKSCQLSQFSCCCGSCRCRSSSSS